MQVVARSPQSIDAIMFFNCFMFVIFTPLFQLQWNNLPSELQ